METVQITNILEALEEMQEDASVPKSIKGKLNSIASELNSRSDVSMSVNKVLSILDELQENSNLQSFTRTQLFNLASMLEVIQH